jgi:two-component system sensor histidine kinase DesK
VAEPTLNPERTDVTAGGSTPPVASAAAATAAYGTIVRHPGRYRPFFILFTLIFLAVPVSGLVTSHLAPLHAGLAVAAIALIVATLVPTFRGPIPRTGSGSVTLIACVAAISAIAFVLTAATGQGSWVSLFYFSAVVGSRVAPDQRALTILGVIGVAAAIAMGLGGVDPASSAIQGLSVSLIGSTVFSIGRLQRTNAQLLAARDEIGRLAVAEERARIARDLHDTLGHDLSVIALKSELAGRLLPTNLERAAAEIADVQRVARESLASVRETIGGYRRPTLDAELAEVRASLAAAGIEVLVSREPAPLPAAVESVLAWAVREASTNILRHSGTSRASIRIGQRGADAVADIVDDGPAREPAPSAADAGPIGRGPGHGLTGLRERVAARGGRLDAGPTGSGGYRLHVQLPLEASA